MMFDAEFREVIYAILFYSVVIVVMFALVFDNGATFAKPETLQKAIQQNAELREFIEARISPITNDELEAEILRIRRTGYATTLPADAVPLTGYATALPADAVNLNIVFGSASTTSGTHHLLLGSGSTVTFREIDGLNLIPTPVLTPPTTRVLTKNFALLLAVFSIAVVLLALLKLS